MKKLHLLAVLLCFSLFAEAQSIMQMKDNTFNYGAKVGFNASFPTVNSLTINGQDVSEHDIEYQVGYLAALLCRINIKRFFIQPSVAWNRSEGRLKFSIPEATPNSSVANEAKNLLKMRTNSLDFPVLVGYNLVKKAPYGLSVMFGPRFQWNYKEAYKMESTNSQTEFVSENAPFGMNIAAGIGVRIGRLFFDFLYDFGINKLSSDFSCSQLTPSDQAVYDIHIKRHTNQMSISLGFLF